MPYIIGDNIDILCNIEARPTKDIRCRDSAITYYDAVRAEQKYPGSYLGAKLLQDNVKAGDTVLIITGCTEPGDMPCGETDGPLGAAALARTLYLALGARCVICCPEGCRLPMEMTLRAAGCYLREKKYLYSVPGACALECIPDDGDTSGYEPSRMLDAFSISTAIFVGAAEQDEATGKLCSPSGVVLKTQSANTLDLFRLCKEREIPTLAVGGSCPEWSAVKVPSTVVNWGAYGICAMLAFMQSDINLLQDQATETRMLKACAFERSVDAQIMLPQPSICGVTMEGNLSMLTLLRQIVTNGMRTVVRVGS